MTRLKDDQRMDLNISDEEMKEIEESEREIAEVKALDWKVVSAEYWMQLTDSTSFHTVSRASGFPDQTQRCSVDASAAISGAIPD